MALAAILAVMAQAALAPAPRDRRRAPITVTITGNGLRSNSVSSDETAAYCARFRLTVRQVRGYFARAETVDDRAYNHDLDMSRCHARGTVRLPDGDGGRWTIDRARRGVLVRRDGSRRYMVCTACPAPPFDEIDPADAP
ncbi:hypothetical protein [Sphingomonas sp. PB4P5]|uniref:hypothetical protein n=1 Tax=Parasphingomonas puruogangriensis TaxID=3096155 RepID=UPI002FCBC78B